MKNIGRAAEIIRRLSGECKVVEVGVETGKTSAAILLQLPQSTVYMVDQWRPLNAKTERYYLGSRKTLPVRTSAYWDGLRQQAVDATSFAKERAVIIQKLSIDAASDFLDKSLDLVFIDAEHSYEAVKQDIKSWLPKIKDGGWLGGHDYGGSRFPGVQKAVEETLGVSFSTGSDLTWWHRRPSGIKLDGKFAIVSMISHGREFLTGAIALGRSLAYHAPQLDRVLLVEEGQYSERDVDAAKEAGWLCKIVPPIRSQPAAFRAERWPYTFTKLHAWNLTEYERVFYLDADCCVHSSDFLWLFRKQFVNVLACHVKSGVNARFNAGVMMLSPDAGLFEDMRKEITTKPSSETDAHLADQGFLNKRFKKFTRIADKYNQRDWQRPRPGVLISHHRPHPWKKCKRPIAIIPYWNEWRRFAGDFDPHKVKQRA